MRYDLAFFLCCCKSFLGSSPANEDDFYVLLGVERHATPEEIKRAYKRQSLQMHPDKLAQKGKVVTEEDQARFTRMKEAYDVLSDQHKRETYDAIGERGMKWVDEPFSLDPQELAHNFAASSTLDRSKIFGIFVAIAIVLFLLPILVCLQVDNVFGKHSSWLAVLTPLWVWDAVILLYHSRVIMLGPIPKPDHVPQEEWVDPLPMFKRIFSLFRFLLVVIFEVLGALRLDGHIAWKWSEIFTPVYIWEATTFYKKWPIARMKIVTVEDLETALGKSFAEFTAAEKELISRRYSVVPSTSCPEFDVAHKVKSRARQDLIKLAFRILFYAFLITELDTDLDYNWWGVFIPFWIMSFCICCGNYQSFSEVLTQAAKKDPETFGFATQTASGGVDEENPSNAATNYGAVGADGEATTERAAESAVPPITPEEREELRAQVMASGSKMMSKCCSQAFVLLIVFLFVGKIQGAGYSSIWIISPLLIVAGIVLCCLGCTIFCITELPQDMSEFEQNMGGGAAQSPQSEWNYGAGYTAPPASSNEQASSFAATIIAAAQAAAPSKTPAPDSSTSKATWDPEKGQVWEDTKDTSASSTPPPETAESKPLIPPLHPHSPAAATPTQTNTVVDLLDDPPQTEAERPDANSQSNNLSTSLHELD